MSSEILWQFKRGDKIAQLLFLPYVSINSSNDVWTGRFSSTDQKHNHILYKLIFPFLLF